MPWDPRAREGAIQLLTLLKDDDVYSLCKTCTEGKVAPTSVREAVRAILDSSASVVQLLGRRKITMTLLKQYASRYNIRVEAKAAKPELQDAIIAHWRTMAVTSATDAQQSVKTENTRKRLEAARTFAAKHGGASSMTASRSIAIPADSAMAVMDDSTNGAEPPPYTAQNPFAAQIQPPEPSQLFVDEFFRQGREFQPGDFFDQCHLEIRMRCGGSEQQFDLTTGHDAIAAWTKLHSVFVFRQGSAQSDENARMFGAEGIKVFGVLYLDGNPAAEAAVNTVLMPQPEVSCLLVDDVGQAMTNSKVSVSVRLEKV
eukprot:TRINITY_DN6535_c0_g1_i4.p1 TRINITY_DN6535_c0_g1~~TRINITY_DN6535_c0_g1_i4.p1  ORF type:complete len:314 (+),score=42.23 TRINITY_DN6535_c0_g1_i4:66-1007(+)